MAMATTLRKSSRLRFSLDVSARLLPATAHLDDLVRVYPKGVPVAPRGAPRFIY